MLKRISRFLFIVIFLACVLVPHGAEAAWKTSASLNDVVTTWGTTTTTAETKITMEFDDITTGIGQFHMGSISVPMVLNTNPGAAVVAETVNILHSAGAGDCDDLIAAYEKSAISGDGDSGITIVGTASRAYVGTAAGSTTVADECYGAQPWASHYGTGAITAMSGLSAKLDVNTGNFTASTVNAGHFHIEGAATVTSSYFDGVMIEVYGDVTNLDSGLHIMVDSGATVAAGLKLTGAMTNSILLPDDAPMVIGTTRTNAATKISIEFDETTTGIGQFQIGDLSNAQVLNTNPGSTVVGQIINITHSAGAGDCDDLMGLYVKTAVSGDGDSGTTVVPIGTRAYVSANSAADEVYGIQPWLKHSGTGTMQAGSAVSAALILNDGDAFEATNSLNVAHFHVKTYAGAANGTVTSSNFDGVMVEVYGNVTGLDSCLHMTNAGTGTDSMIKMTTGTATNVLEFAAASNCVVESGGTYSTADGYMVVKVGSNTYRVPFFSAVD